MPPSEPARTSWGQIIMVPGIHRKSWWRSCPNLNHNFTIPSSELVVMERKLHIYHYKDLLNWGNSKYFLIISTLEIALQSNNESLPNSWEIIFSSMRREVDSECAETFIFLIWESRSAGVLTSTVGFSISSFGTFKILSNTGEIYGRYCARVGRTVTLSHELGCAVKMEHGR